MTHIDMAGPDLVSMIVPVYNVEQYLDACIESLVAQTYTNLEILLINDGSTDHSGAICMEWLKKDDRIVYVSKKNETLGPSRNMGIRMAKGKYIAFVDSDDWIDPTFVQKLHERIIKEDKDLVRCDYCTVQGNRKRIENYNEYYPCDEANLRRMIASTQAGALLSGLYKKSLWLENGIEMPPGPHQDTAILGLPFIYAKKTDRCREGLYYYRDYRQGGISQITKGSASMLPPLRHLVREYKERRLFAKYRDELEAVCIRKLNIGISEFVEARNQMTKKQYVEAIKEFLQQEFGIADEYYSNKMAALGSYNIQRVLSRIYFNENVVELKFQSSSIISIMAAKIQPVIEVTESFRDKMIWNDCTKKLISDIQSGKIKYILIDLMEEINDILDFGDGRYATYSDALKEKDISLEGVRIIKRNTRECRKLWKNSCVRFRNLLKEHVEPQNIFLVKFFLAEGFGKYEQEELYPSIDEIREANVLLHECYDDIERNFAGIHVLELDSKYAFTDVDARYGCYPWHLNDNAQFDIQSKVNKVIKRGNI